MRTIFGGDNIIINTYSQFFILVFAVPGRAIAFALKNQRTITGEHFYQGGWVAVQSFNYPGIVYAIAIGGKRIWDVYIGALFSYLYLLRGLAAVGIGNGEAYRLRAANYVVAKTTAYYRYWYAALNARFLHRLSMLLMFIPAILQRPHY